MSIPSAALASRPKGGAKHTNSSRADCGMRSKSDVDGRATRSRKRRVCCRIVSERIRLGVALHELGRASKRATSSSDGPTREELDAFCDHLGRAADLEIVAYAAPRYDRLLHRLKLGEVDLAWLAPVVALDALRSDVTPVALPARGDTSWYWAALFVRDDSPLFGLATLHQARAVWVDERSASGYLVIRAALEAEGFDVDRGFQSQSFARSHEAAVREVLADPYAVGATYLHLDQAGSVSRAGWGDARVRELKRAGPIPSDVLAASSTLKNDALERIRRALCDSPSPEIGQSALPLFGASRFTPVGRAEFAHLRALERYLIRSAALPTSSAR